MKPNPEAHATMHDDDDPAAALVAAIHEQRQQQAAEAAEVRAEYRAAKAAAAVDPELTPTGVREATARAADKAERRMAELRERHEAAHEALVAGLARRAYGSTPPTGDLGSAASRVISLGRDGTLALLRAGTTSADVLAATRVYHDVPEVLAAAAEARGAGAVAAHLALAEVTRTPTVAERLTTPPPTYTLPED